MPRLYGRSATKRCYGHAPDGRWKTTTMLSVLRSSGETQCIVHEGGTTKEIFENYVEKQLCLFLNFGNIVIIDNLSAHKSSKVIKRIETCGVHVLYLPPYNPDLNSIEKCGVKLFTQS